MQIFRIRKTVKDINEAKDDPARFAAGQAKDFVLGFMIAPLIINLVICIVTFLFGFVINDGNTVLRVLFFIFFIPLVFISFAAYSLQKAMKNVRDKVSSKENRPIDIPVRDLNS